MHIGTFSSKAFAYGRIQLNYSNVEDLIPIQTECTATKSGKKMSNNKSVAIGPITAQRRLGETKDTLIIGLLLNDSMLCKPKKTLYQS